MKFDVLYNFISPVTGRVLCDPNYVLMGDSRGIAMPSPILTNILDASFVIGFPNASLPNAQVLNALADGYVYNTEGILSTTPTVIPFLTEKKLWIGDATNTPTEYSTIFLENLPPLGLTIFPDPDPLNPDLFVGEYYEGTSSGVPRLSSRIGFMVDDLTAINARFFFSNFVLNAGSVLLRTFMPNSQFLEDLAPGGVAKIEATGQISIAVPGTDYGNVSGPEPAASTDESLALWDGVTGRKIKDCPITVIGGIDIQNVNSLSAVAVQAKNTVTSDNNMISRNNIQTTQLLLADPTSAFTKFTILEAPSGLVGDLQWTLPDQQGTKGQVLTNVDGTQLQWTDSEGNVSGPEPGVSTDGSLAIWDGVTGRKIQDCIITVIGSSSLSNVNTIFAKTILAEENVFAQEGVGARTVSFFDSSLVNSVALVAPDVIISDVKWELPAISGNAGQVLTNTDGSPSNRLGWTTPASTDALYILQAGNVTLPNAQALDQLMSADPFDPRILKATDTGIVELAVKGDDYGNVSGPDPAFSIIGNIAIWEDADGRKIADSEVNLEELQVEIEAADTAAKAADVAAKAAQTTADAAAATASAALEQAEQALFAAGAAGAGSILGGIFGGTRRGPAGAAGTPGLVGPPGAAGASGKSTLVIDTNISVLGGRIQDIAASPEADFDAVSARWVWDLLNDNVEIKWE